MHACHLAALFKCENYIPTLIQIIKIKNKKLINNEDEKIKSK